MLEEFQRHNLFWEDAARFEQDDPHLSALRELAFVHPLDWWQAIDWEEPGIFILTGGRQIGKSTSTKLLIRAALRTQRFVPRQVFYLPCDQVMDAPHLLRILRFFFDSLSVSDTPFLLIIDEVTFVKEWPRTIKALADEGWFRRGFCLLTGSDSVVLKDAAACFPGRRGRADIVDFHLRPLSFRDYVRLVAPPLLQRPRERLEQLFEHFGRYLACGGFLRAMNDFQTAGSVRPATYATFEQWIRGDFIRRGKSEHGLLSVLQVLFRLGISQGSYSELTRDSSLSKETFIDYCHLLERMDLLLTLQAFDQNRRHGAPKKARKFHLADPFIRTTIAQWLRRERMANTEPDEAADVEATVAGQYAPSIPSYYIKAEGEIDLLLVIGKRFLPIEVKWSNQVRPKDLAQLKKYPMGVILTKAPTLGRIEGIRAFPLPLFLCEYPDEASLLSIVQSETPAAME